eukprot:5868225-Ditylum_brightwellii.AAC.1
METMTTPVPQAMVGYASLLETTSLPILLNRNTYIKLYHLYSRQLLAMSSSPLLVPYHITDCPQPNSKL